MPYQVSSHCQQCQQGDTFFIGVWNKHKGVFLCRRCQAVVNIPLETGRCPGCDYAPLPDEFYDYARTVPYMNGQLAGELEPGPTCPKCHQGQLNFQTTVHHNLGAVRGDKEKTAGQDYLEKAIFATATLAVCADLNLDPVEVFHYFDLDIPRSLMSDRQVSHPIFMDVRTHIGLRYMRGSLGSPDRKRLNQRQPLDQPLNIYRQAIRLTKTMGNKKQECRWLGNLGRSYLAEGQTQQAIDCCQQAVTIAQECGDVEDEMESLTNLGHVYRDLERLTEAKECYLQSLKLARQHDHRQAEAIFKGNVGDAYLLGLGSILAIDFYQQALSIAREIDDKEVIGHFLIRSGIYYHKMGQIDQAKNHLGQALTVLTEIKSPKVPQVEQHLAKLEQQSAPSSWRSLTKYDLAFGLMGAIVGGTVGMAIGGAFSDGDTMATTIGGINGLIIGAFVEILVRRSRVGKIKGIGSIGTLSGAAVGMIVGAMVEPLFGDYGGLFGIVRGAFGGLLGLVIGKILGVIVGLVGGLVMWVVMKLRHHHDKGLTAEANPVQITHTNK